MNSVLEETIRIPAELEAVYGLRQHVRALGERDGLSPEHIDDLVLAVSEAATNAIRYGSPSGGETEIRWTRKDRCIRVEVEDTGVFRKRIPIPDLEEAHGRGIPLIIALMDEMHIREGTSRRPGTVIRLVKCPGR
jgi:anti-sigma regulatory factor (Ser/Thr protein kinase)